MNIINRAVKNAIIFLCFFLSSISTIAQQDNDEKDSDSVTYSESDTTYSDEDYQEVVYHAPDDSIPVQKRSFSADEIRDLKTDPDLNYKQAPTVAESLWDRFLAWIAQMLDALFSNAVNTDWGRIIVYAIGLVILIVVIMMLLKVNAFKILYSGAGAAQKYQVLDEDIHEMDFERLIQDAVDLQDYRRGVRLVFLYALKLLSDKELIYWQSGKTNHDYVAELGKKELKTGFNELSFYFDYAWYGNFPINHDTFRKIQHTFSDWRNKIS
jgi:uncharacterized protein DUF4129